MDDSVGSSPGFTTRGALLHCVCVKGSELEAGDEILFSYGNHSNGRLFITYGFCLPRNPYNVLPLRFDVAQLRGNAPATDAGRPGRESGGDGAFDMARFHAEATANLVAAKLLAGAGPSVADAVVASITRDEVDLESTNAMRAAMAIAQAATSAGPKGGREQTPLRALLLALALLHRSVTRAIAEEQAGISRADIPGLISRAASDEADAANVDTRRGEWTARRGHGAGRDGFAAGSHGRAARSGGVEPALLRACASAVADVGRVCAPNAGTGTNRSGRCGLCRGYDRAMRQLRRSTLGRPRSSPKENE